MHIPSYLRTILSYLPFCIAMAVIVAMFGLPLVVAAGIGWLAPGIGVCALGLLVVAICRRLHITWLN